MVYFTRACKTLLSENNKTRLAFEKQQEKNKNIICRPCSVRIEKNCALGLEHGPPSAASGRTQDLWHSFSQYGPPGRQIIYISGPHARCTDDVRQFFLPQEMWVIFYTSACWDRSLPFELQREIPSKRESSARVDYVPALCTHRPSPLPIEWFSEAS